MGYKPTKKFVRYEAADAPEPNDLPEWSPSEAAKMREELAQVRAEELHEVFYLAGNPDKEVQR